MSRQRLKSSSKYFISSLYRQDLRNCSKPVNRQEAVNLLRLLQSKDTSPEEKIQARDTLIICYLPLAYNQAKREFGLVREEAVGVANVALVKAVDRIIKTFNPEDEGLGFTNYLTKVIRETLTCARYDQNNVVMLPKNQWIRKLAVQKAAASGATSTEDIATQTGLSPVTVRRVRSAETQRIVSLDESVGKSVDGEESLTYNEVITNTAALSPEEIYGTEEGREYLRLVLLRTLTDNEYQVLARSLGLLCKEPMTYAEIALELNTSITACRLRVSGAYKRLRELKGFKQFLQLQATPPRFAGRTPIGAIEDDERPVGQRGSGKKPRAKLTPDQVREIRVELGKGVLQKVLAERYNIARSVISAIHTGKTWRDVK